MHERGDCTPTGDNAFLHELELDVRTELTLAETTQPEEADVVPGDEWLPDPHVQRYDVLHRALLDTVEAMADASGLGGHPPPAEMSGTPIRAERPR